MSQTSFGPISTNSLMISTVSMALKSSWKDLLIDISYILRQSRSAEISGKSVGNYVTMVTPWCVPHMQGLVSSLSAFPEPFKLFK